MSKVPKKSSSKSTQKHGTKTTARNQSLNSNNRRFSIISNSYSDDSDSSDSDSHSESDSNYDHYYKSHNQNIHNTQHHNHPNNGDDDDEDDDEDDDDEEDFSSSSDDDNIDFVQLTKQRRMKAMKAVKGLKKTNHNKSTTNSPDSNSNTFIENDEPELDDDLVDAVIQNEEKKMNNLDDDNDVSQDKNNSINDDMNDLDFNFDFDDDINNNSNNSNNNNNNSDNNNILKNDSKNVVDKLKNEDIGEVIDDDSKLSQSINDKNTSKSTSTTTNTTSKVEIDVPKFNEKEINSDDDYEFDNDDLIQTLMKDNDDLELQNLDNTDDDFDYLIANQHNINMSNSNNSNNNNNDSITQSVINTSSKSIADDSIDDNAYLMKEETQAMLDDFNNSTKNHHPSFKNRRSSMYYNNTGEQEDLDDLDLDLLNNFEQFLPKQQAIRRRSSILNQTLLSSDSDLSSNEIDKMIFKKKMRKVRKSVNNTNNLINSNNSKNSHAKDIKKMLGISNSDSNFMSNYASNAIADSDDDTKLLEYIFEDSESDLTNENINSNSNNNGNETDEDLNLPKKTSKKIVGGIKNAKEILSSSNDKFCAPKLGTFITTKRKPFSIIDGFSTRFLHPLENSNHSVMQKAASIKSSIDDNNNNNSNIALDELLNISEFDEDYSNDNINNSNNSNNPNKYEVDEFFGEKNIPLTAFRNKNSLLINSNVNNSSTTNPRKFSFTDRLHRRKHHKSSKSKTKPKPILLNNRRSSFKFKKSSISPSQQPHSIAGVLVPKNQQQSTINNDDPSNVDEVLLIGVEPYLDNSMDNQIFNGFEIKAPTTISKRDRKSISRVSKSSKSRMRRASMVEAQAEGLRQTKNGLFDENIMEDVEALLIDMGDAEEYGFLFGSEV